MKQHAIIPIFITHRGCPNMCVFCNQKAITTRSGDVTVADARKTIESYLSTLNPKRTEIEISFFGGSFTGIPIEEQIEFLKLGKEYKDAGKVSKLHCSTRPDYINPEILDNLKTYGMDVIELGVQSFDEEVLLASKRGHKKEDVYRACRLIKEYGFTLGIQLMIGLPKDSKESCLYSAREAAACAPQLARLYPTVVLPDTELNAMWQSGEYEPRSLAETVDITKEMYKVLTNAGINVMRIGLKSNENIKNSTYHPAIGQIVKSEIVKEDIEKQILSFLDDEPKAAEALPSQREPKAPEALPSQREPKASENLSSQNSHTLSLEIVSSENMFNFACGYEGSNKKYFKEKYPDIRFSYRVDKSISKIIVQKQKPKSKNKKKVYVSKDASEELLVYLRSRGLEIVLIDNPAGLNTPVANHPDIYMCKLKDKIYFGDSKKLGDNYPCDVLYNSAAVGKYLICSKHTDQDLIKESGLVPLMVHQGYVKCNLVVVDDTHVITEDEGIARKLKNTEIDCLLVQPKQVLLSGYEYGFIGGATGRIGNTIIFNGNIKAHPDYKKIKDFIESLGLKIKSFSYPLTDIGSIIVE